MPTTTQGLPAVCGVPALCAHALTCRLPAPTTLPPSLRRWAGLMRGAVSVALVYYFFDPHGSTIDRHKSTMITTTLVLVLVSILAFGAVTRPLLDALMGPQQGEAARSLARSLTTSTSSPPPAFFP